MDRKFLRLVLAFFSLVALLCASAVAYQLLSGHGGFEFRWNRSRYEQVAEAARRRAEKVDAGDGPLTFRVVDWRQPSSLLPLSSQETLMVRGEGSGLVWVHRANGRTCVWIETVDRGHVGEWGYAWSSDSTHPDWPYDAWGERWSLVTQLDAHWWTIEYRLG